MDDKLEVKQDKVILAVKAITNALESNGIDQLTGAVAMRSILNTLAKNGLDLRSEPTRT